MTNLEFFAQANFFSRLLQETSSFTFPPEKENKNSACHFLKNFELSNFCRSVCLPVCPCFMLPKKDLQSVDVFCTFCKYSFPWKKPQ